MMYCAFVAIFLHFVVAFAASADITLIVNISNVTNEVNPWSFGANTYTANNDGNEYTVRYPIMRAGGEVQSRYNWNTDSQNLCHDWFYITEASGDWKDTYNSIVNLDNGEILTQVPAMGWVGRSQTKQWSFSQAKYGPQQKDECDNIYGNDEDGEAGGDESDADKIANEKNPFANKYRQYIVDGKKKEMKKLLISQGKMAASKEEAIANGWCAQDAGNGVWTNGSNVVGNDPNDANVPTNESEAFKYTSAILENFGSNAPVFEIDNEPCIWHSTHRDVHPIGATYDEITGKLLTFGPKIKEACSNNNVDCKIIGPSSWGWCGYFTSGYDSQNSGCTTGSDREAHDDLTLLQYYLQQAQVYETQTSTRLLDYLDIHYYPAASGVTFSCDESSNTTITNRLQAPRSLYDYNYNDGGSWIGTYFENPALILRLKDWINKYYPGTKLSITEYNFGDDTCITSTIATCEVLAIFATYGVDIGTHWGKPTYNSLITNAWKIYLNYDGYNTSIFGSNSYDKYNILSAYTKSNDIERVTGYSFYDDEFDMLYVYSFNKMAKNVTVEIDIENDNNNDNNKEFNTNGDIQLYGIDQDNGLSYIGIVADYNKINSNKFIISMPQWTVRMCIIKGQSTNKK